MKFHEISLREISHPDFNPRIEKAELELAGTTYHLPT